MELTATKYMKTEVGLIPEDWLILKIEDLIKEGFIEKPLDGNHGNIHPKKRDFVSNGIPFIMANNIVDGQVDLKTCSFIKKEQADNLQKGFSFAGDVLITHKGTIGNVTIVPKISSPYIMLTPQVTYYRIKDKKKLNKYYVKAYFENDNFQNLLKQLSGGGTRAYIGITKQKKLPFVLPPTLVEQKSIAQVLSDADTLVQALVQKVSKKKLLKKGVMQKLLTPRKGWISIPLTEAVDYIHGKAHEQYIVKTGKFVVVNSKYISRNGTVVKYSNSNFCKAKTGDILTVLSDLPNGKALAKCFYVSEDDRYAVNQRICIWRPKKYKHPMFLKYLLNRHKYFLSLDDGVTQTHILNHHIEKCEISIPNNFDEQKQIGNILFDIDKEIAQLEQKLSKYRLAKQGMMQQLLTGKIRIP
jgi:type I restriction enzyme S subunit